MLDGAIEIDRVPYNASHSAAHNGNVEHIEPA